MKKTKLTSAFLALSLAILTLLPSCGQSAATAKGTTAALTTTTTVSVSTTTGNMDDGTTAASADISGDTTTGKAGSSVTATKSEATTGGTAKKTTATKSTALATVKTTGKPTSGKTTTAKPTTPAADPGAINLIACSDVQQDGTTGGNVSEAAAIVKAMKKGGVTTAAGFFCLGDYTATAINDLEKCRAGYKAIRNLMSSNYGSGANMVFLKGNHDPVSMIGNELSVTGAHDAKNYGVYAINESDFARGVPDEATIKNTAANLKKYLTEKTNAHYDKPVFVLTHVPLHYSMRCLKGEGDGMYASYLFDVLNNAGNAGLNIIVLFGHNHSNGWDDYLGGASIYLPVGSSINVAQCGSHAHFDKKTLAFTYMNAGYVGYYADNQADANKTLTMTVFTYSPKYHTVTMARYSKNGLCPVKARGVSSIAYKDAVFYPPDTRVFDSPQVLTLKK